MVLRFWKFYILQGVYWSNTIIFKVIYRERERGWGNWGKGAHGKGETYSVLGFDYMDESFDGKK